MADAAGVEETSQFIQFMHDLRATDSLVGEILPAAQPNHAPNSSHDI